MLAFPRAEGGCSDAEVLEHGFTAADQLLRHIVENDLSLNQHHGAIGNTRDRAIIFVDDDSCDTARANLCNDAPDLARDERREAFGCLIENEQIRIGHQSATDSPHPLPTPGIPPAA